ncbi:ubiquitin-conjugating enzyme E2 Ze, partial [Desmophyllum pertusum]
MAEEDVFLAATSNALWDPVHSKDWDKENVTPQCILRIKRDIMSIYNEPPPGMCIVPDKEDMTKIHALITGPFDTPYEGGFFYFMIRCPPDYPIRPPRVKVNDDRRGAGKAKPGDSKRYNECIQHESLRVAVCDMLEGKLKCPSAAQVGIFPLVMQDVMEKSFPEFYDYYVSVISDNSHVNGQNMLDPFGEKRGTFDFFNGLTKS